MREADVINKAARGIVINHRHTKNCIVVRKKVNRNPANPSIIDGVVNLSSEDEENIEWELLGNGYMLPADLFSASKMMDNQDANNNIAQDELRFLIEPEVDQGQVGWFSPQKYDVCFQIVGNVRLAFEVVAVETTSNVPPYTQRYVCNRRDDMHFAI